MERAFDLRKARKNERWSAMSKAFYPQNRQRHCYGGFKKEDQTRVQNARLRQ